MIRLMSWMLSALLLGFAVAPCAAADASKAYVPDLGDFMGLTQLRHFKLWYAGRTKDWDLADYEIEQIRLSFSNALSFHPKFGDLDMAKMIETDTYEPLDALKKAVAARDPKAFGVEFGKLTAACNACHEAAHLGFIKIGVPTASPFSNQLYSPTGK
jgi:hypothetical protein